MRNWKKACAAVAAAVTLAVAGAPAANADVDSYIRDLEASPWGFYGAKATYISIGYGVCHRIQIGYTQWQLATWVVANTGTGIFSAQAHYIVEAAEVHLCGAGGNTVV